jgi:hypothetical protein
MFTKILLWVLIGAVMGLIVDSDTDELSVQESLIYIFLFMALWPYFSFRALKARFIRNKKQNKPW